MGTVWEEDGEGEREEALHTWKMSLIRESKKKTDELICRSERLIDIENKLVLHYKVTCGFHHTYPFSSISWPASFSWNSFFSWLLWHIFYLPLGWALLLNLLWQLPFPSIWALKDGGPQPTGRSSSTLLPALQHCLLFTCQVLIFGSLHWLCLEYSSSRYPQS